MAFQLGINALPILSVTQTWKEGSNIFFLLSEEII